MIGDLVIAAVAGSLGGLLGSAVMGRVMAALSTSGRIGKRSSPGWSVASVIYLCVVGCAVLFLVVQLSWGWPLGR